MNVRTPGADQKLFDIASTSQLLVDPSTCVHSMWSFLNIPLSMSRCLSRDEFGNLKLINKNF